MTWLWLGLSPPAVSLHTTELVTPNHGWEKVDYSECGGFPWQCNRHAFLTAPWRPVSRKWHHTQLFHRHVRCLCEGKHYSIGWDVYTCIHDDNICVLGVFLCRLNWTRSMYPTHLSLPVTSEERLKWLPGSTFSVVCVHISDITHFKSLTVLRIPIESECHIWTWLQQ